MKKNRGTRMNIAMILLAAVLLSALVMAGACSKKEGAPEQKSAVAAPETEAEHKDGHQENDEHQKGTVDLTPDAIRTAGIEVSKVVAVAPSELINATAVLEMNADRLSRVGPRVTGRCVRVNISQGDRVQKGQVLAEIDSVEMDQAWSDYLKARARLELTSRNVKREEMLFQKKISPEMDLLKARQEFGEAEADMLLAREKFRILGADLAQVDGHTSGTEHQHPMIPVSAPLSGVVIEKTVTLGEVVGPDKTLFTIADLSTLWLQIDIYERDIGRIRSGMKVKLSVSTYPGKEFRGHISYIADLMDEKSRTVKARVTIDNGNGLLKPGMFASTSIASGKESASGKVIAVPAEAVFLDGSERFVFIQEGDHRFVVRKVLVGPESDGKIEIKEGLKAGVPVVIKGVFALKSEFKKKTIEVHKH